MATSSSPELSRDDPAMADAAAAAAPTAETPATPIISPPSEVESEPTPVPVSPTRPWKPVISFSEGASSIRTVRSGHSHAHHPNHQDYLDSLVPPSSDEFAQIAARQAEREAQSKRRSRDLQRQSLDLTRDHTASSPQQPSTPKGHGHHGFFSGRFGFGHSRRPSTAAAQEAKAAAVIQRTYRGYRARRELEGFGLDASTRWTHTIRDAQWREMNRPRPRPQSGISTDEPLASPPPSDARPTSSRSMSARQNWRKVTVIARRAGADVDVESPSSSSSSSSSTSSSSDSDEKKRSKADRKSAKKKREEAKERRRKEAKMMGLQYFLEMVDLKHRYGANLRVYHEAWKKTDTSENFFYWLDHGEGRLLDIEACPRERLEREQVRYLSREERQYYLVEVDEEGRLCWAKNGARIDTTEAWKDSIHGIVPADDPTPAYVPTHESETKLLGDSSTGMDTSSSDSDDHRQNAHQQGPDGDAQAAQAVHYATTSLDNAKGVKKIKHLSATVILDRLMRKSVRKNTWIFVADTSFRLYVGIKNSGAFQHSSFLQGSRISAAGLIKIKHGRLSSLSPLSGHYRPPASNFRAFLHSLKEEGVDMSRVRVSKSYAVLVGLETYVKVRKKGKDAVRRITHTKSRVVSSEETKKRGDEPAKQTIEEGEEAEKLKEEMEMVEENTALAEVMQVVGTATEPKGQKGGGDDEEVATTATTTSATTA